MFSVGDIIENLVYDKHEFSLKIVNVRKNVFISEFSEYEYKIICKDEWNHLDDVLYPLIHIKLIKLIDGKLPLDYNSMYVSL
jgi:hypothetical protein